MCNGSWQYYQVANLDIDFKNWKSCLKTFETLYFAMVVCITVFEQNHVTLYEISFRSNAEGLFSWFIKECLEVTDKFNN